MKTVIFDIETTGLDISKDTPIQVSAVALDENLNQFDKMSALVYRTEPLAPIITKITGLTMEILKEKGLPAEVVVGQWQQFLKKHYPVHLMGYNVMSFDFPMIMNWINTVDQQRFKFPPVHRITDVMHMVCSHFGITKWLKLADAAERLGLKFEKASLHNADADVALTADIWKTLQQQWRKDRP